MERIVDFKCKYNTFEGFGAEIVNRLGISFPEVYRDADGMARLAAELRKEKEGVYCVLPFDHALEAECLGADIKYGDDQIGPRVNENAFTDLSLILEQPPIDFSKGRMADVLEACRLLKQRGEKLAVEINGPFTVLNTLIEIKYVFKAWRKDKELLVKVLNRLADDLMAYFKAVRETGCDMICYTDGAGGVNILGPQYAKQIAEEFTVPFLKRVDEELDADCIIQLCPKTSFLLSGLGLLAWDKLALEGEMKYGEACLAAAGRARFVGPRCYKEENVPQKETIAAAHLTV